MSTYLTVAKHELEKSKAEADGIANLLGGMMTDVENNPAFGRVVDLSAVVKGKTKATQLSATIGDIIERIEKA